MGANHGLQIKFTWGSGYANTLYLGLPADNVIGYSSPRPGYQRTRAPSGVEDAWRPGTDYILEFDVGEVPSTDDSAGNFSGWQPATGWEGASGFEAFIDWCRDSNKPRFFPDASSGTYIECHVYPPEGAPELEDNGTRRVRLKLVHTSPFTGY